MDPVPVFQGWSCDLCGECGEVEARSDQSSDEIKALALRDHAMQSWNCPGRLRFLDKWTLLKNPRNQ